MALFQFKSKGVTRKLVDLVYPVGSLYFSTNSTNPSTLFGGTWQPYAQGRTIIGAGTGNDGSTSMSFTAGQTGGEYKHKLIVDEIASHSHKTTYKYGTELSATNGGGSGWTHFTCNNDSDGVNAAGGDKPHNNIQPYIATNIWRRVS